MIPGQGTKIPYAALCNQKKNNVMFVNMLYKLCVAFNVRTVMSENVDFRAWVHILAQILNILVTLDTFCSLSLQVFL